MIPAPPEPWRGRVISLAALVAVAAADRISDGAMAPFYSLPVALAAFRHGWIGGLATALASSALLVWVTPELSRTRIAAEALSLVVLGIAAGLVGERDRRQKRHYQKVATQLSELYKKVQENFEAMKRAERLSALGQLSAGLAHEIRNPLASISGAASILQRNPDLDAKQSKCVEIIAHECQRLNGLLTNFLNFARPRAPRYQMVDIEALLDRVLLLAGHGVQGKAVRFEKQVASGLPRVECDPEQLEQVLLNLAINAVEASPDGGKVILAAALEDRRIALRVIDEGHGVAPADIDRLFDPFFTTKEHGTGLGLPVAHQIMRQMGGSILAQRNTGAGMTFSVILAAKQSEA